MELTLETAFDLVRSQEEFPVDFDDAWQWIEYSRKDAALRSLKANFEEGVDFSTLEWKSTGGRPLEGYYLTVDCFKSFCMMAGTEKGKQVRQYFLACEKELKRRLRDRQQPLSQRRQRLVVEMVSEEVVSRQSKFRDEFYEMLYRKRGGEWEKRDTKNRPSCVGRWTNEVVYDRMLGGTDTDSVKSRLQQVNPRRPETGTRKNRHHWHFDPLGEFHLQNHFAQLQIIDRLTPDGDWDKFRRSIARAFPNDEPRQLSLLDLLDDMKDNLPFEQDQFSQ